MKFLFLILTVFLTACSSKPELPSKPQPINLKGKVVISYVETMAGMLKGQILHIEDPIQLKKVSDIGNGDPRAILLLNTGGKDSLDDVVGRQVFVEGEIEAKHIDAYHTDFIINVGKIFLISQ